MSLGVYEEKVHDRDDHRRDEQPDTDSHCTRRDKSKEPKLGTLKHIAAAWASDARIQILQPTVKKESSHGTTSPRAIRRKHRAASWALLVSHVVTPNVK